MNKNAPSVERPKAPVVLLADLNVGRRSMLQWMLRDRANTIECNTLSDLAKEFRVTNPAVLVVGRLVDQPHLLLDTIHRLRPAFTSNIVLVADQSSEDLALCALRAGVRHYFRSPICLAEIAQTVLGMLPRVQSGADPGSIVCDSDAMRRVKELVLLYYKHKRASGVAAMQ
jgi:DNA-binding NarL/FixJ family response regulator